MNRSYDRSHYSIRIKAKVIRKSIPVVTSLYCLRAHSHAISCLFCNGDAIRQNQTFALLKFTVNKIIRVFGLY